MDIRHEMIQPNYTIRKLRREWGIAHWHQRMELVYVIQGRCEITIGNTKRIYEPGDLAVIHSGEVHSVSDVEDSALYVCTFDSRMLQQFCSETKEVCHCITADMLADAGIQNVVLQCFEGIFCESNKDDAHNEILILADLFRLYGLLVQHFEQEPDGNTRNKAKLQQFQEALRYIEENYTDNITLQDVAQTINYNATYVSTLFGVYTGLNFKTYLDSFRVHKAVKMLKGSCCTIADISAQCGFSNIRTFNNVFRKVTGMTPSEFRNIDS